MENLIDAYHGSIPRSHPRSSQPQRNQKELLPQPWSRMRGLGGAEVRGQEGSHLRCRKRKEGQRKLSLQTDWGGATSPALKELGRGLWYRSPWYFHWAMNQHAPPAEPLPGLCHLPGLVSHCVHLWPSVPPFHHPSLDTWMQLLWQFYKPDRSPCRKGPLWYLLPKSVSFRADENSCGHCWGWSISPNRGCVLWEAGPPEPPLTVYDTPVSFSLVLECGLLTLWRPDNCLLALDFGEDSSAAWIPRAGGIDARAPPAVENCGPIPRKQRRWGPSLEHFCHLLETGGGARTAGGETQDFYFMSLFDLKLK